MRCRPVKCLDTTAVVVLGQGHAVPVHVHPSWRSVKQLHVSMMNHHCSRHINAAVLGAFYKYHVMTLQVSLTMATSKTPQHHPAPIPPTESNLESATANGVIAKKISVLDARI